MAPVHYSWAKAKDILTQTEKDRLACLALVHLDQIKADWNAVAAQFGSASGGAASVGHFAVLKKLREKGGTMDDDGAAAPATPSKPTPTKSKAAASGGSTKGRKRKVKTEDEDDGDTTTRSPTKKNKKRADSAKPSEHESIFGGTEDSTIIGADVGFDKPFDFEYAFD